MISQTQIEEIQKEQDIKQLMLEALLASKAADWAHVAYLAHMEEPRSSESNLEIFLQYKEAVNKATKLREMALAASKDFGCRQNINQ